MRQDIGVMIGLLTVASGVVVLGLSYLGAYMIGRMHGRRDAERELDARRMDATAFDHAHMDRLVATEEAVQTVARAMERVGDAQRIMLLEQARQAGMGSPSDARPVQARLRTNTPA